MGRKGGSGMSGGGYARFSDNLDKRYPGVWFDGDGHEQSEFFSKNSNNDEILESIRNDGNVNAYWDWSSGGFMNGQQYKGWDSMSDGDKRDTQIFDDYIDKSVINKGFVAVRKTDAQLILGQGNVKGNMKGLQAAEGRIITCPANMSFSVSNRGLSVGSSKTKNVEIQLYVPGGAKGAGLYIGDKRVNRIHGGRQREFMTNRDSVLRVGKTTYDSKRKVYTVDVYWMGHTSHDYGNSGRVHG